MAPPQPTAISGDTYFCSMTGGTSYSVTPVTNALHYTWSVPSGWAINSVQDTTIISTTPGSSGNICVNASNLCGDSPNFCISVTATSSSPTLSLGYTTDTICRGSGSFLQASGASSYTWMPGATLSDSTIATPIASPTTTTVYTVIGSNICGYSVPKTVNVAVLLTPGIPVLSGISNPLSLCPGIDTVLNVTSSGSFYQTWYDNFGNHIYTGPNGISISDTTVGTDYYGVLDSAANGCMGGLLSIVVNINPIPVLTGSANSNSIMCVGVADTLSVVGAASYIWAPSMGLNIDTGSGSHSNPKRNYKLFCYRKYGRLFIVHNRNVYHTCISNYKC